DWAARYRAPARRCRGPECGRSTAQLGVLDTDPGGSAIGGSLVGGAGQPRRPRRGCLGAGVRSAAPDLRGRAVVSYDTGPGGGGTPGGVVRAAGRGLAAVQQEDVGGPRAPSEPSWRRGDRVGRGPGYRR